MILDAIVDHLDRELNIKNDLFPNRDAGNDDRIKRLLTEFIENLKFLDGEYPSLQVSPPAGMDLSFVDRAVFLCGYMKCGTTLLLELLDGHPELVVMPGDSWFIDWINKDTLPNKYALESAWDHWVKRMVNSTGQSPFWIFGQDPKNYWKFRSYLYYWYDQFSGSWVSMLVSIVLAYYCLTQTPGGLPKYWVEKTPGNEFKVDKAILNFPKARFIHIVRDPRENLASLKCLYETRNWQWDPLSMANKLGASCRKAVENQKKLGADKYHVFRYEAMTENPRSFLTEIAEFLEIKWDYCMLQPTVNSIPAQSNTMHNEKKVIGKIRKANEGKWKTILTPLEKRAVLCTLGSAKGVGYHWNVSISDYFLHAADRLVTRVFQSKRIC